jgi:uncharacterized protein (TIGR03435 family)
MRIDSRDLLAVGIFGGGSRLRERIEVLVRRRRTFSPRASSRSIATAAAILAALLLTATLAPRWIAFAQATPRPAFEVASIKPGDPSVRGFGVGVRGNLFITTNATLKMIVEFAYDLRDHQISGGPTWLNSATFTIEAKPVPQSEEQLRLMVQSLLAERFRFRSHRESRIEPVYELVVAKGGHRLKEPKPQADGRSGIFGERRGDLNGYAAPMAMFANVLSQGLGRSVIDKTALPGKFDFKLIWTPGPGEGGSNIPPDMPPPADTSGPSIFTAIQEQLGLRLESSKGPVDVLVIDHAEKPDAN